MPDVAVDFDLLAQPLGRVVAEVGALDQVAERARALCADLHAEGSSESSTALLLGGLEDALETLDAVREMHR